MGYTPRHHPLLANKGKVSICHTEGRKDYSEKGTEATILLADVREGGGATTAKKRGLFNLLFFQGMVGYSTSSPC